jgi:hypothetical protein
MTTPNVFTQWSTIEPFLGTAPGWIPTADKVRISAYQKYEEIYWSSEEGFLEVMRGDNENPVFVPTARTLINTVDRYTAPDFSYTIGAPGSEETDTQASTVVQVAQLAFEALFAREQFWSKFGSNKLKGLYRGDWLWHVIADDMKPLGRRIKIMAVDPAAYFPVTEADVVEGGDAEKIVKVHLAEPLTIGSNEVVSRMTYERVFDNDGNQTAIMRSHLIFKPDEWAGTKASPTATVLAPEPLPPEIPAIPVYHLKNIDPTAPFGSSELRGLESALLGINQTVSDEDLTLAIEGIGVYATDGGAPRDEQGRETDWIMGPGRVLTQAINLRRISGATSLAAYGEHYDRLVDAVRAALGASDAAVGKVGTDVAESGIALALQLAPIIAHTKPKDQNIIDVHAQMFHDLCYWLTVYEELPLLMSGEEGSLTPAVLVQPTIGNKIPINRKQVLDDVVAMRMTTPALISMKTAVRLLREAGYDLEENELDLVLAENEEFMGNLNGEQDDAAAQARRDAEAAAQDQGATA